MNTKKKNRYLKRITKGGLTLYEGDRNNNMIIGSDGDDQCIGKKGDDLITANKGNDIILGGPGKDTLIGGAGDDILIGGMGNNALIGGPGIDTFFISYGKTTIEDFDFNDGDKLLFGMFLTNIQYKQDGDNVLVKSDQGTTTIVNQNVNEFISYGHP